MLPILDQATEAQIEGLLDLCDGLLLPGGSDIDPSLYGEEKDPLCKEFDNKTDIFQLQLLKQALAQGKPVLGICKGSQLINVGFGGTLYQDYQLRIENTFAHDHYESPTKGCHTIMLKEETRLRQLFKEKTLWVNSLHHQQVKDLGKGLKIAALSEDGGIEAIESENENWCLGVQWHPEAMMMGSSSMLPVFTAFTYASRMALAMDFASS